MWCQKLMANKWYNRKFQLDAMTSLLSYLGPEALSWWRRSESGRCWGCGHGCPSECCPWGWWLRRQDDAAPPWGSAPSSSPPASRPPSPPTSGSRSGRRQSQRCPPGSSGPPRWQWSLHTNKFKKRWAFQKENQSSGSSYVKVEVAVLGSRFLISLVLSVDVQQHWKLFRQRQRVSMGIDFNIMSCARPDGRHGWRVSMSSPRRPEGKPGYQRGLPEGKPGRKESAWALQGQRVGMDEELTWAIQEDQIGSMEETPRRAEGKHG